MKVKHVLKMERCCLLAAAVAAAPCEKLRGLMLLRLMCAERLRRQVCDSSATARRPSLGKSEQKERKKRKVQDLLQPSDV